MTRLVSGAMRRGAAVAVMIAVAPSAHADDDGVPPSLIVPDRAGPIPDRTPRFEAGLGLDPVETAQIGHVHDLGFGVDARGALRYDRMALALAAALIFVEPYSGTSAARTAIERRYAIDGRYSIFRDRVTAVGRRSPHAAERIIRTDIWVGGGVGYEQFSWSSGGTLSRPDVDLGLGLALLIRWGEDETRHATIDFALHAIVARSPTSSVDATPTGRYDDDLLFTVGILLGN